MLADAGVGSRRQIEGLIAAGRIVVDGRRAKLGERLSGGERVFLDGRSVKLPADSAAAAHGHLAYYKPAGELTSQSDPQGRERVFEALPRPRRGRWINVGRLDLNTLGLLLFTTDGELAHRLMHPRYRVPREYAVRVLGAVNAAQVRTLKSGVELDDGRARFDAVERSGGSGKNIWYHVTLHEGRNREVRRMFEAVGLTVSRLIRVRYGPVELGALHRGETRTLSMTETMALYRAVRLPDPGKR
ncbi:pseudouridine synthase [Candidatus Rariloculus sp.]|uniref:pseudouridine synthase n=1 Tax=Candidatus Rariloculus sp. TaxID=3101265 RepID=UPI003D0C9081